MRERQRRRACPGTAARLPPRCRLRVCCLQDHPACRGRRQPRARIHPPPPCCCHAPEPSGRRLGRMPRHRRGGGRRAADGRQPQEGCKGYCVAALPLVAAVTSHQLITIHFAAGKATAGPCPHTPAACWSCNAPGREAAGGRAPRRQRRGGTRGERGTQAGPRREPGGGLGGGSRPGAILGQQESNDPLSPPAAAGGPAGSPTRRHDAPLAVALLRRCPGLPRPARPQQRRVRAGSAQVAATAALCSACTRCCQRHVLMRPGRAAGPPRWRLPGARSAGASAACKSS